MIPANRNVETATTVPGLVVLGQPRTLLKRKLLVSSSFLYHSHCYYLENVDSSLHIVRMILQV